MFDRFKKPRPGEDAKPAPGARETPPASNPSVGGFGRRQTPAGAAQASDGQAPSAAAPNAGFGKRPAAPRSTEPKADNPAASAPVGARAVEVKNDTARFLIDWLMVELRDQRGIHCETMMTVLGALAGFAAQQAVWAAAIATGATPKQAFTVMRTKSGESFYFGEPLNQLLASTRSGTVSVWQFVAGAAQSAGATALPDLADIFAHTSKVVGSDQFGIPRLPAEHMPRIMPREAVNRYWPTARSMIEHTEAGLWPMWLAMAAARLIGEMKHACEPGFACSIVMEAAVPMSKIDPATVPKGPVRH